MRKWVLASALALATVSGASATDYTRTILNNSSCIWKISVDGLWPADARIVNTVCYGKGAPSPTFGDSGLLSPMCETFIRYYAPLAGIGKISFTPYWPVSGGQRTYDWSVFLADPRGVWIHPGGTTPNINMNRPDDGGATIFSCPGSPLRRSHSLRR